MRIKKFLSAKCPVCSGICLSCVRRRRLYCCFAVVGGGSSPCRTKDEGIDDVVTNVVRDVS